MVLLKKKKKTLQKIANAISGTISWFPRKQKRRCSLPLILYLIAFRNKNGAADNQFLENLNFGYFFRGCTVFTHSTTRQSASAKHR